MGILVLKFGTTGSRGGFKVNYSDPVFNWYFFHRPREVGIWTSNVNNGRNTAKYFVLCSVFCVLLPLIDKILKINLLPANSTEPVRKITPSKTNNMDE